MKDFMLRLWDSEAGVMRYSDTWQGMHWDTIQKAQREDRLMVSSGLKDTNGRLLFEGDFVNVFNTYKDSSFKAQLLFKNGQFVLETVNLTAHNRWINYEMLYIGNCFESPGLLQIDEQ